MDKMNYEFWGIPQFIDYYGDKFDWRRTAEVYNDYLKFWNGKCVNKIAFSRYIVAFTEYQAKSVSVGGQKFRAFIKKTR